MRDGKRITNQKPDLSRKIKEIRYAQFSKTVLGFELHKHAHEQHAGAKITWKKLE